LRSSLPYSNYTFIKSSAPFAVDIHATTTYNSVAFDLAFP
jgi:hypothetical protein